MNHKLMIVLSIALLLAAVILPAAAAPLATPCAPGAAYDPACDVDHDNDVDIFDIQLAAGHWNQAGVYTSDNDHNHLGQNWTGSNNPLKLTGSYGTNPDNAALVLSNSAAGGNGLEVDSASTGVRVNSASSYGAFVNSAGLVGVYVNDAGYDGMYVHRAGTPSSYTPSAERNGFEVAGAQGNGLYVGHADNQGVFVGSASVSGVSVHEAGNPSQTLLTVGRNGFEVAGAEGSGFYVGQADDKGVWVTRTGHQGVFVQTAGFDGVQVQTAGIPSSFVNDVNHNGFEVNGAEGSGLFVGRADRFGVQVLSAGFDGVRVDIAGTPSSSGYDANHNGFEVNGAEGSGLFVGRADRLGVQVLSAGLDGILVNSAGNDGVRVDSAGDDGVEVYSAGDWAGYFGGYIYVDGSCFGCLQAHFAVNAGDRPLEPGDVVSIEDITVTDLDTAPDLWQVVLAQPGRNVVGVVAGRAELDTDESHGPDQIGRRLVPREGPAQAGEYVTVIYSGPMQVRAAPGESAITAGTRLTAAATPGEVRELHTFKVQLADGAGDADMLETAPVIGVALEAPKDGLVWVLVNPQ